MHSSIQVSFVKVFSTVCTLIFPNANESFYFKVYWLNNFVHEFVYIIKYSLNALGLSFNFIFHSYILCTPYITYKPNEN